MEKISVLRVRDDLDEIIQEAWLKEPALSKRLKNLRKWIARKKNGFLTSRRYVLDFLVEVIVDSRLWLDLKILSSNERKEAYSIAGFTPAEIFWIEVLFPVWFNEVDPKLKVWKNKIMSGEFHHNDEDMIGMLQNSIESCGGSSVWRYILDLSMATDIAVVGQTDQPICVQLTISSGQWLEKKKENWEKTLRYWNITRGLIISYTPAKLVYRDLASSILEASNNLPETCYSIDRY